MKVTTLNQMFEYALREHGKEMIFYNKAKKDFVPIPLEKLYYDAQNAGLALMQMGLKPGEKVGLLSENRAEWQIADLSVLLNAAVNVPRGTDSTAAEVEYILNHSDSRFTFVEHEKMLKTIEPVLSKTSIEKVIVLDPEYNAKDENVTTLAALIKEGEAIRSAKLKELTERSESVKPDDLFTIIYTSGTTGAPKGVMLTHQNMVYNIEVVPEMIGLEKKDIGLSILPVWHIFERAVGYAIIYRGAQVYYTNIRDLRNDFASVRPTFMASAPRLWESLYQGIKAKVEKSEGLQRTMFNLAFDVNSIYRKGLDYLQGNELKAEPEDDLTKTIRTTWSVLTTANLFLPSKLLDQVVFSKIRAALGGRMRGTISGGGALPPHVDEFFNVLGIPVYEGYGMTECAPIIAVRTVGHVVQQSVGYVPVGTQVRILDDTGRELPTGKRGTIHVKGPQVMKGYYKNKEATDKVLQDGWLNTGDVGFISYNGTLSIRGRAKDTIVLLGGENVEPVPIENMLVEDPYIDQVIVVGQDQKTLAALIWPNIEKLKEEGVDIQENEDMNQRSELRKKFTAIIKETISAENGFKAFERLTDFRFLPKPMEVGDELTNLYKMKRNVIYDKYASLIQDIYTRS